MAQRESQIEDLLRKAQSGQFIRVIVRLRIPEGMDATREERIKSAQQALLAELSSAPHRILRAYSVTPALALEVSREALLVLRDSPHVLRVDEDAVLKPLGKD